MAKAESTDREPRRELADLRRRVAALERAEMAQRFLIEASQRLAGSLDYQTTLATIVHLAVPSLADLCILDVLAEDQTIQRVAVAHADPAKAQQIVRGRSPRYPPRLDAPAGVGKVLRTGEPELYPTLPDSLLVALAQDETHLALLRSLGFASYMVVPLIAHGRTLGALSFVIETSGRSYDSDDLALARDLAGRAALAVENARLFQAEQAARAEAEAAARQREEFVAVASHELRSPLTALKGYTQLLTRRVQHLDQVAEPEREPVLRITSDIGRQVARLETLIADLLDIARLQQGRLALRPAPTDLIALAQQVLARHEQSAEWAPQHRLVLAATEPVAAVVDPARIDQVLTNLVSNALKYSPAGGEVRVELQQRPEAIELTVTDQGIGIPVEEQARLFQPFARGQQARALIGGVGLGLYIAAQIVASHGGQIDLDSQPGQGTTFRVRLPHTPPAV